MTENEPESTRKTIRSKADMKGPDTARAGDSRDLTVLWRARSARLAQALGGGAISREMLATVLRYDIEFRELFSNPDAIAAHREQLPEWVRKFNELRPSPAAFRVQLSPLKLDGAIPPEAARRIEDCRPIVECLQAFLDAEDGVFLEVFAPLGKRTKGESWARLQKALACARGVEADLRRVLIGQSEAVAALGRLAFRVAMGSAQHGPAGIALFLGPPGVGKTLAAQTFANALASRLGTGRKAATLTVDGTHYTQYSQSNTLIGGDSYEGTITRFVREQPEGVVIVNEFEKMLRRTLESFLPVLDQGVLRLQSRTVDFHRAVFIFTSNLGGELWDRPASTNLDAFRVDPQDLLGLASTSKSDEDWWSRSIPREFLSRLAKGEIVLFRHPQGHHRLRKLMDTLTQFPVVLPTEDPGAPADDEEDPE